MPRLGHDRATEKASVCGVTDPLQQNCLRYLLKMHIPGPPRDSYTCQIKKTIILKATLLQGKHLGFIFLPAVLNFHCPRCPLSWRETRPLFLCHFVPSVLLCFKPVSQSLFYYRPPTPTPQGVFLNVFI